MSYLVLVRLVHKMSGLSLGMIVVLGHNPVADLVLVHFAIFVQISEVRELLPLGPDPVWLWTPILVGKHVSWRKKKVRGFAHEWKQRRTMWLILHIEQYISKKLVDYNL